jgi:SAM-dependent methyltransferase
VGDLPKYYGLASVFVLPSLIEPWGLVVNEAMACGLPILASRSSGCAYDLVHEGENGFRFDPRDPEALAGLMLRMSSGEVDLQAMGNASRRIISQWTPATFASSLWRAIGSACRLSGKTGNVKEDHSPRRGPDVNINKTAAMSNEASFSSTTPEEYAEGAPQIKHAVLRGLYRELAASVYREACGTCQQPSLLDLGAGEGSMTRPFLELGARVTVVDISERRLAALQASCTGHTDRLELICDDVWNAIAKARKNGRQFNIVTMNAFMHHIPDYIGLIREAMTVLAPEGLFFSFQDPMRYDSLGTFCRAFSNIAYYSWRVFRGDLVGGIKRCFRRARGVFLEDCPADLVDYHGVRNGVDQEAVCRLLESNGFDCRITQYFSTQSRAWQPIGIMLGLKNTFGVVAKRRPPAVLPRGMNTSARIRTER